MQAALRALRTALARIGAKTHPIVNLGPLRLALGLASDSAIAGTTRGKFSRRHDDENK